MSVECRTRIIDKNDQNAHSKPMSVYTLFNINSSLVMLVSLGLDRGEMDTVYHTGSMLRYRGPLVP